MLYSATHAGCSGKYRKTHKLKNTQIKYNSEK